MQAHEQCAEGEDRMAKGRRLVRKREALRAWSRPKGIRSWCFTCVVGVLAASPTAFGQSVSGRTVPAQRILSGGDARISARVGEGFFAKYIRLDLNRSSYWAGQLRKPPAGNFGSESDSERQSWYVASTVQRWERPYQTPHWTLVYAFRIPEKPWVRGTIEIDLDSTGVQVGRRGIVGIGRFANHPEECQFSIDQNTAHDIARRRGLEKGLSPWSALFLWQNSPYPGYVWRIKNTLRMETHLSAGRQVVIDANTGLALYFDEYEIAD